MTVELQVNKANGEDWDSVNVGSFRRSEIRIESIYINDKNLKLSMLKKY
jgi:hypothetical protein